MNWFRFVEPAGTKLPDTSPPKRVFDDGKQICGTYNVAWIDGPHPNVTDTVMEKKICFTWFKKKCLGQLLIDVGKCSGKHGDSYYVYQLKRPSNDTSKSAYCAL